MVYLKPLYSRLDRQRSQYSTGAQQEHVKISFFKLSNIYIKTNHDWKILSLYDKMTSA